jgi:hypothetical protein
MTAVQRLHLLLVEDDHETLTQLLDTLPKELGGCELEWEPCESFERALKLLDLRRYDIVVTDVYQGRVEGQASAHVGDAEAPRIIEAMRWRRICPIVAYSDGPRPKSIVETAFVKFADKSDPKDPIVTKLLEVIATGVPLLARKIHDELDRAAGSYLWDFLEGKWSDLVARGATDAVVLERIIRRRAAIQLSHLDPSKSSPVELGMVEGVEFYLYPPVSGLEMRLGDILRKKADGTFFVVITPHCHLVVQPNETLPRADYVLLVHAIPANDAIRAAYKTPKGEPKNPWSGDASDRLRKFTQSPSSMGKPTGRHWFLPGFLELPNLFCDFLQVQSISLDMIGKDFDRMATLASPFAEALQACFGTFFGAVGIPVVNSERFKELIEQTTPPKKEKAQRPAR